jgi:hypothetical protein
MWTGHVSVPNPHYYCAECGRNLWSRFRRLRNPMNCPAIFEVEPGRYLCQRCFCKEPPAVEQPRLF